MNHELNSDSIVRARGCSKAMLVGLVMNVVFCLISIQVYGQTAGTGAISGSVVDRSKAPVPGAHVKIISLASGEITETNAGSNGAYYLPFLLPGAYKVEITKSGFKAFTYSVQVNVTETQALNTTMEVSAVQEVVTVHANVEQLQTDSSSLGHVTTGEQVQSLPLSTGNFTQIIGLNPGVSAEVPNAGELGRGGSGNNQTPTVSHGGWAADNNFQMNGAGVNDAFQSSFFSAGVAIPSPEGIQEFKVQTGQYDASYGRNAGANVDLITRGGTQQFHGSVFEFFRNTDLNANSFFRNFASQPRPVLNQNRFGADVGGPIIRDKLQFFVLYQGIRQRNGLDFSCSSSVTEPALTNDRSATALGQLFAGQTGLFGGTAIAADGSNINPVALALLNLKLPNGQYMIPTPQKVDPNASGGFDEEGFSAFSLACPFTEDQFMTNLDYRASEKSHFSGRFFFANSDTAYTLSGSNLTGGPAVPGFPVNLAQNFRNFSLTHTYLFAPSLINQAEISFHRILGDFDQAKAFTFPQVGINVGPADQASLPAIGINQLSLGGNGQTLKLVQNVYSIQDSLTWVHGKHAVQLGSGLSHGQIDIANFTYLSGEIFNTWADFMIGLPAGPTPGGNGTSVSNLALSTDLIGQLSRAFRDWDPYAYVQDNFKLTSSLTLNLGFRYERVSDFSDALGRNAGFDLSKVDPNPPAGGSIAGTTLPSNYRGPVPAGAIKLNNDYGINGIGQNTINPRVGFAWQLPRSNHFVLRGGYGLFHTKMTGNEFFNQITAPPFGLFRSFAGSSVANFSEQMPLPLAAQDFPVFTPYSPATANAISPFDADYRPPSIHEYSLGVQSQLPWSAFLEVGYAGSRGLHITQFIDVNQAALASSSQPIRGETTNTLENIQLRVPYEGFGSSSLQEIQSAASYWYDSLLVSLIKQLSYGFRFQASYSLQKELGTAFGSTTGFQGGFPWGNQNSPRARYGADNFIRPQRLVINYSYEIPSLRKRNAFVSTALGGWRLSGVTTWQTGQLLTPRNFNGTNIYGVVFDRAQLTGKCSPSQYINPGSVTSHAGNGTSYLNTTCFTQQTPIIGSEEPPGTCSVPLPDGNCPAIGSDFGNAGVGIFQGPGQVNFDLSVAKRFDLHWLNENAGLEFRSEFFNLFNHPSFANPDTIVNNQSFGQIRDTIGNPRIVQFGMKVFF